MIKMPEPRASPGNPRDPRFIASLPQCASFFKRTFFNLFQISGGFFRFYRGFLLFFRETGQKKPDKNKKAADQTDPLLLAPLA